MTRSAAGPVVLTGGTSGIGKATVERLLAIGVDVIAIGRDAARCRSAEIELGLKYPNCSLAFVVADLATTGEVRRAAIDVARLLQERWDHSLSGLSGLVNNAAMVSTWRMVTDEGYEKQFAVNHLAGFLLSQELLPLLERGSPGRVVTVSSRSHRGTTINWRDPMFSRGYTALRAYKQSKLANVLFTAEFNRRYAQTSGVRAYAFDPGLVRTDIGCKSSSGIEHLFWRLRSRSRRASAPELPAEHLAALTVEPEIAEPDAFYRVLSRAGVPDRAGRDLISASRLWELSEQLCNEPEREVS